MAWKYNEVGGRKKSPTWDVSRQTDLERFKQIIHDSKIDPAKLSEHLIEWSEEIQRNKETYPTKDEYRVKAMELAYLFLTAYPSAVTDNALMLIIAWHNIPAAHYYRAQMRGNAIGGGETITF